MIKKPEIYSHELSSLPLDRLRPGLVLGQRDKHSASRGVVGTLGNLIVVLD